MKIFKHKNFTFYTISVIILAVCVYFIYRHYKPAETYIDTITLQQVKEHFDGTGKVFAQHNNPSPTCQPSKDCFPGSYVKINKI